MGRPIVFTFVALLCCLSCSRTLLMNEEEEDTAGGGDNNRPGANADADIDGDADSDADTDTDTDVDTDTDTGSICDGCLIDAVCYSNGETYEQNVCEICDPSRAIGDWSHNDGVACAEGGSFCAGLDVCVDGECVNEDYPCSENETCFEDEDRCCEESAYIGCGDDGNTYFFDSCDHQEEMAKECIDEQFCRQGVCSCADGWTGPHCDHCVIYVNGESGNDSYSGDSWAEAKQTVQAGIDTADDYRNETDCEVWVAAGTYRSCVEPQSGVAVYGGFVGTEASRKQRDWSANKTVLSGDIGIEGDNSDNCGSVVHIGLQIDEKIIIDGFTITDGNSLQTSATSGGGGIRNNSFFLTVANCTIQGNSAAKNGGGMINVYASPTIINCMFVDNSAAQEGGGIYNYNDSSPTITNCIFHGNTAENGGGIYNASATATITNCTFHGNSAKTGGGLYNGKGTYADPDPAYIKVTNTIMWGNVATEEGPEIYNDPNNTAQISYSNVSGGCESAGNDCGLGNISEEPRFVDVDTSNNVVDLNLTQGSPCIDTGSFDGYASSDSTDIDDDGDTTEYLKSDIEGNPRILGNDIDMGAYETPGVAHPIYSCPVHVKPDGDDTATGESWSASVATVQKGIRHAKMSIIHQEDVKTCEVWVKTGRYLPTDGDSRHATFTLQPSVNLFGGFAGTETARVERVLGPSTLTTLSGDLKGDDILGDLESNKKDNVYHVATGVKNTGIDGFTISGGNANGERPHGGGMINVEASPLVRNCTFLENTAGESGGGMYNYRSSTITDACLFENNSAKHGGGLVFYDWNLSHEPFSSLTYIVTDSTFVNNSGCDSAGCYGGGLNNTHTYLILNNSIFQGNSANTGGGFSNRGSTTTYNCVFHGNSAEIGGGMYGGGAVTNCTFYGNTASAHGGGIYSIGTSTMSNCILWGNTADENPQIRSMSPDSFFRYNNIQEGCEGLYGICGEGNIDEDPMFVDDDAGDQTVDLQLKPGSPCIDTGSVYVSTVEDPSDMDGDGDTEESPPFDVAGQKRVQGNSIDMGAYEFSSAPVAAFTCPIHVKTDGDEAARGDLWNAAVATVQTGISRALMALHMDEDLEKCEVWVKRGLYLPAASYSQSSYYSTTFQMHPAVHLYGGFIGDETVLSERALGTAAETVLSGDLYSNDVSGDLTKNRGDNVYHVVTGVDNAVIDGFTITGAMGTGMYNYEASPVVRNCIFRGNSASNWHKASTALDGGGMYNRQSSPEVTNCIFHANSAEDHGGGVYNYRWSSPKITNCIFQGNTAENGGGISNLTYSFPVITNCIFWNNSDTGNRPEIYTGGSSSPIINHSDIQGGCHQDTRSICGDNNIDADPLFIDDDYSDVTIDLRLQSDSPCIDVGLDSAVPSEILIDIDGSSRFNDFDGIGNEDNNIVDMGAYETS